MGFLTASPTKSHRAYLHCICWPWLAALPSPLHQPRPHAPCSLCPVSGGPFCFDRKTSRTDTSFPGDQDGTERPARRGRPRNLHPLALAEDVWFWAVWTRVSNARLSTAARDGNDACDAICTALSSRVVVASLSWYRTKMPTVRCPLLPSQRVARPTCDTLGSGPRMAGPSTVPRPILATGG